MHNLTKIRIFRVALQLTYPVAAILLYPIIAFKRKNPSHLFFFFDRYAIGGAQRVHLDILESVRDIRKKVYFTRRSMDDKLKKDFYSVPNTENHDIHFWCDNLLFRLFSVHYFAFYINRHPEATVFGSNSTFFYDLLPFLKTSIVRLELLHNFTHGKKGMEFFGLANRRYLNMRLVIDGNTLENIKQQYQENGIDKSYLERLKLVEFGVPVPEELRKNFTFPLRILYAGRGGLQKRVWLISRIAEYFIEKELPVEFHFAGPVTGELSAVVKGNSVIHGEIGDKSKMNELYNFAHAIILTSSFEGFPMVIKEGMAYGCVPVVTALPGNKTHLKHLNNSLLIEEIDNEEKVIAMGIENIKLLLSDHSLLETLSANAYHYAKERFRRDNFMNFYRRLLASGMS